MAAGFSLPFSPPIRGLNALCFVTGGHRRRDLTHSFQEKEAFISRSQREELPNDLKTRGSWQKVARLAPRENARLTTLPASLALAALLGIWLWRAHFSVNAGRAGREKRPN